MDEIKEYKIEEAEENFDNDEFMIKAIENNATWVLAYASERILSNKEIILKEDLVEEPVVENEEVAVAPEEAPAVETTETVVEETVDTVKEVTVEAVKEEPKAE